MSYTAEATAADIEAHPAVSRMVVGQNITVFDEAGLDAVVVRTRTGWVFEGAAYQDAWSVSQAVAAWQSQPKSRTTPSEDGLSPEGRDFMATNYHFALAAARRAACFRYSAEWVSRIEDAIDGAAVDALIEVAQQLPDTTAEFEGSRLLLLKSVRRAVQRALGKYLGSRTRPKRQKEFTEDTIRWTPDKRFPAPVPEAIRREEEALNRDLIERTRAVLGDVDDVRNVDGTLNEHKTLQTVAHHLGLFRTGTIDELRQRIAEHVRRRVFESPAPERPTPGEQPNGQFKSMSQLEQEAAERREAFASTWSRSLSAVEVANKLGWPLEQVMRVARHLRRQGVAVLELPKYPPRSIIRGVRDFAASCN